MFLKEFSDFLDNEKEKKGTELYIVDKMFEIYNIELTIELSEKLTKAFIQSIKNELFDKDIKLVNIDEIDDYYPDHIMHLPTNSQYNELNFFMKFNKTNIHKKYKLNVKSLKNILGFILIIGNERQNIILFKYLYPVNLITNDKVLRLIANENRLDIFNNNVITFNNDFDFFKYKSKLYIINLKLLERNFKYDKVIIEGTKASLEKINKINILEDPDSLSSFISDPRNLKWAKKIRNLAKSPVLNLNSAIIKKFIENNEKLIKKFIFNKKKIVLSTKTQKQDFIRLLEDDYLKSELTSEMYEADKKSNLV